MIKIETLDPTISDDLKAYIGYHDYIFECLLASLWIGYEYSEKRNQASAIDESSHINRSISYVNKIK
jgi:hypothetical protein